MLQIKAEPHIRIHQLLWLYFWLLIFEGALRKWVVPMLANFILLIRDPIVIWIYILAFRQGILLRSNALLLGMCFGWLYLVGSVMAQTPIPVALYGLRTDFMHLPLIFLMARYFDHAEVRKIGSRLLWLAVPMAILMAVQFSSPAGSWINAGSDEGFQQLGTARGHIRAPGTFSFISGPINFYALVTAFVLAGFFNKQLYPRWLLMAAGLSVGLGMLVSGSRSVAASVGIVVFCGLIAGLFLQPRLAFRTAQIGGILALLTLILLQIPVVSEGMATLSDRFGDAKKVETGFVQRGLGDISLPVDMWYDTPFWGYGLGMGTNVGAMLREGKRNGFSFGEGEWSRIVNESGPMLGFLFLAFRIGLVIWMGIAAAVCTRKDNILPFLLWGACALPILNGQWGQATTLGFAIFGGSLCRAAMNTPKASPLSAEAEKASLTES